ncbi:MAG: hypothetical protein HY658_02725, partial [Actinobacteria bacterium]|nr:hypothetical protein [Actinomycetota bacterium]
DGRVWTFAYSPDNQLKNITSPDDPATPENDSERVAFEYDGYDRLIKIKDGEAVSQGRPGWEITYTILDDPKSPVDTIHPPGLPAQAVWNFDYGPNQGGSATVEYTQLTDPQGSTTAPADDRRVKTDFNSAGLPIRISGPADDQGYWPQTTMVWDTNGNMLCQRSPVANAVAEGCLAGNTSDALNTEYTYDDDAPFRLLSVLHPDPDQGDPLGRTEETYSYDGGWTFTGLWMEKYTNKQLKGVPMGEQSWGDMDNDWANGSPGIGQSDNWSIRLTGFLDIPGTTGQNYKFRLYSNDGANLIIGNSLLTSCFGQTMTWAYSEYNCGTSVDAKRWLKPGLRPIVIELQEQTGAAKLKLEWNQGNGNWQVVPPSMLKPNLGLLTSESHGPAGGGTQGRVEVQYTYPSDDAKARRSPSEERHTDQATTEMRKTAFAYDSYGRVTSTTKAAGTAFAATTTFVYTDTTGASGESCLTQVTDPLGAVITNDCTPAGDIETTTLAVRAAASQPAQSRTTSYDLDPLGRVLVEDPPGDALITYDYDFSGRRTKVDVLIDASTNRHAVTEYVYDDMGRLLTEKLPDPDGSGPKPRPQVSYSYDHAGNVTQMTDVRGQVWTSVYDAHNRVVQTTTPTGLVSATAYRIKTGPEGQPGTTFVNDVRATAPDGVVSETDMDIAGRPVSEKVGTLTAATYTYDTVGNVVQVTSPAGVTTENDYNAFGQVTVERRDDVGGEAVTTYAYDAAGRLATVDGPRPTADKDLLTYTYDLLDRVDTVAQGDPATPLVTVDVDYDDAGEQVRITQSASPAIVRTYTYDTAGRPVTSTDARGTTTNTFNAAGWVTQVSDPRGIALRFEYDDLGN